MLAVTLEELANNIPQKLDDIITKNRDKVSMGLATQEEIESLVGDIEPGRVKDTLYDWRVVAVRVGGELKQKGLSGYFLLSCNSENNRSTWRTSDIERIDFTRGLILTRNSLYALDLNRRGEGEPNQDQLLCLCGAFTGLPSGDFLGILPIFY